MRRLAVLAVLVAGCGDGLRQGDRVVLVDPKADTVYVAEMPNHAPQSAGLATFHKLAGTEPTSELVAAGTRATVVQDSGSGRGVYRGVKVMLVDPPYAGIPGVVKRCYLRRE